MYLSYYGLQKKPFQVSADPSFLWLGDKHKEALATLKYGNLGNQGFILLTGDVGTGKTTLINALINSLGNEVIVAKVPDPGMAIIDFMNYISHAFGIKKKYINKVDFLIDFEQFLSSAHADGKKSLLIIDEAQRLSSALLEEIRQLSNIEKQETKLLSIFLVGQNEFNDVLLEHKNRALRQRITLNYVIEPLDLHETGEFIRHRLQIAGAKADIFSPDAIRNVYELSNGFPRKINIICDHSLLLGFAKSAETVTDGIVKECVKDLLLPEFSKKKNNASLQPVDTPDSEKLEEITSEHPEHILEVSSRKGWKTFSTVILIVLAFFIIASIMYREKYRDLISLGNNKEVQSYSSELGVNTQSANRLPDPDGEIASTKGVGTYPVVRTADKATQEVLTAEEPPLVEDVKPVSAVSANDRPEIPEQTPFVPDLPNKEAETPGEEQNPIVTSNLHNTPVDLPSDLNQKKPSNEEETQTTPVTSKTDEVVNKEPENLESGALIDWVIKKRSK